MAFTAPHDTSPTAVNSTVKRPREYLLDHELEALMATARRSSRWGHRDATMILIAYRHGVRAYELCDLQWSQIELDACRIHVRRRKGGTPSTHPLQGEELRLRGCSERGSRPSSCS
jgi:integrase